jgi:hypothetical protein
MKPNYPVGLTIVGVRPMTPAELSHEAWEESRYNPAFAIVLSDNSVIYASRDYEGNGPGALFGQDEHGSTFVISAEKETSDVT